MNFNLLLTDKILKVDKKAFIPDNSHWFCKNSLLLAKISNFGRKTFFRTIRMKQNKKQERFLQNVVHHNNTFGLTGLSTFYNIKFFVQGISLKVTIL